mmetsp:Transcript_54942/g.112179  ORF Transcript_54942/g.112179 Transcript_54942/m.112179 type:complete len:360 (-) Transcript_54942:867-1946(-)
MIALGTIKDILLPVVHALEQGIWDRLAPQKGHAVEIPLQLRHVLEPTAIRVLSVPWDTFRVGRCLSLCDRCLVWLPATSGNCPQKRDNNLLSTGHIQISPAEDHRHWRIPFSVKHALDFFDPPPYNIMAIHVNDGIPLPNGPDVGARASGEELVNDDSVVVPRAQHDANVRGALIRRDGLGLHWSLLQHTRGASRAFFCSDDRRRGWRNAGWGALGRRPLLLLVGRGPVAHAEFQLGRNVVVGEHGRVSLVGIAQFKVGTQRCPGNIFNLHTERTDHFILSVPVRPTHPVVQRDVQVGSIYVRFVNWEEDLVLVEDRINRIPFGGRAGNNGLCPRAFQRQDHVRVQPATHFREVRCRLH